MNTSNPFLNALYASIYIALVAMVLTYAERGFGSVPEHSVLIPIVMLSLFVFSAAVMGYFFLLQPITLLLKDKQAEAVQFFLKTLAAFAIITLAWFGILMMM